MNTVATAVWGVASAMWGPSADAESKWPSRTKSDAVSFVSDRSQNPWREIRRGWGTIIKKLQDILALGDDWDGARARKPDPKTILFCIELANRCADGSVSPPSCVSPTVEGGAVWQWQGKDWRLEVECNEPDRVECMLAIRGQKPKHWVIG